MKFLYNIDINTSINYYGIIQTGIQWFLYWDNRDGGIRGTVLFPDSLAFIQRFQMLNESCE